jgi:hypothetical protein
MTRSSLRSVLVAIAALAFTASLAQAGPPLVCHPFEIGTAPSLAWNATGKSWRGDVATYDVRHLADDTIALLTPDTPVIVRMETLRRAAVYALRDQQAADQLLTRIVERTRHAEHGAKTDALAWFDAGYYVETFRQAVPIAREQGAEHAKALAALIQHVDGYAMVQKSLTLRGSDPAIEFAAAIITLDRDRADQPAHAAKAREGASQDALLAQNIDMLAAWATK